MAVWNIIKDNIVDLVYTRLTRVTAETYEPDQAIATSFLGTPIYSNLEIKNGNFTNPVDGSVIKYSGLRVDAVLMTVSRPKNTIKTTIQGRDGTIVELHSLGDYQIQIVGQLLSNQINVYPKEEVAVLNQIGNAKTNLEITSSFLNDLGIYEMCIEEFNISEVQGTRSMVPFSITAISQLPYDLELLEEEAQQQ